MKLELLLLGTAPCVSTLCLPDVNAHDQIPPLYLHTVSDQTLEVETAWEQGYHNIGRPVKRLGYVIRQAFCFQELFLCSMLAESIYTL